MVPWGQWAESTTTLFRRVRQVALPVRRQTTMQLVEFVRMPHQWRSLLSTNALLTSVSYHTDGPRDAASRPIDRRAVYIAGSTPCVSMLKALGKWPRPRSSPRCSVVCAVDVGLFIDAICICDDRRRQTCMSSMCGRPINGKQGSTVHCFVDGTQLRSRPAMAKFIFLSPHFCADKNRSRDPYHVP